MPFNHNFWKQIQSQQKRKPLLSEVYKTLLENQNVALYSKDIGDSTDIPPAPEGIDKVTVIPKEYLGKIKSLAGLENSQNKNLLSDLFKEKANISPKYHKELVPVIKNAIETSGYSQASDLFAMSIGLNGFFDISEQGESFNVIQAALNGIENYAPDAVDGGLTTFLQTILPDTTKFASTNIGPGELFLILFSDAKVSVSSGKKSGDLEAGGSSIELKASGARMGAGGLNWANQADANIKKFLKSKNSTYAESGFFNQEKNSLCEKLGEILNQSATIKDFLQNGRELLKSEESHSNVAKQFEQKLFKDLDKLLASAPQANWDTLVVSGSGQIAQRAGGVQVRFFVFERLKKIQEKPLGKEETLDVGKEIKTSTITNLTYLLANTFQALKKIDINSITKEDLIKIISYANSYSEDECKAFGYSMQNDLMDFFQEKSVQEILNISSGTITNLVGAMHLCSYAIEQQFDKIMFLNKTNGNALIFNAPLSLQEGLNICRRPDINPDPNVDKFYGSTCKYILKI